MLSAVLLVLLRLLPLLLPWRLRPDFAHSLLYAVGRSGRDDYAWGK